MITGNPEVFGTVKNHFFEKRTGEVVENKGSALKTNRKNGKTNRKTKRAMLLKIKNLQKNEPKTSPKPTRIIPTCFLRQAALKTASLEFSSDGL